MNSQKTTSELHYNSNKGEFVGKYQEARKTLDYSYFSNFTPERQLWQDSVIRQYLEKRESTSSNSISKSDSRRKATAIYTSGVFGAGKGHVLRWLGSTGQIKLSDYVWIDPDRIRHQLPEMDAFIEQDRKQNRCLAGNRSHLEATFLSLLLETICLQRGYSMIVDGSLQNYDWYSNWFQIVQNKYGYTITLMQVQCSFELAVQRCYRRGMETGRALSFEHLVEVYHKSQQSFEQLQKRVPLSIVIDNNNTIPVIKRMFISTTAP